MNSQFIKYFRLGFLSLFKPNIYNLHFKQEVKLIEYFIAVEEDLNTAFNKLKSEYERN